MPQLNICFVVPGFASPGDEGLPAVADLVAMVAARHRVRVVALRHPATTAPYLQGPTMVEPLGAGDVGGPVGRAWLLARGVGRILRLHRERPFQVIHALWADEAGAVAVIAGRLIHQPVVVSVLGGELVAMPDIGYGTALGRGGRWTVDLALRRADLVAAGSSTLLERLEPRVPRSHLALLPLGVDLDTFSPGPPRGGPDHRIILSVGSLVPVKDHVLLLRAFTRVAAERRFVHLQICGDGPLRADLERLAVRLGIGARVEFLGELPRAALVERYRAATMLAVTSRHEAQSMVAVEAAACGIPVVGTAVGCLPDLGEGAVTVPVGDHVGLAAAMTRLLADPPARIAMGRAARAAAVARFDLDTTAAAVLERYEGLIA